MVEAEFRDLHGGWWLSEVDIHIDEVYCQYPYVPAHISKPKEVKSMYMIALPEKSESLLSSLPRPSD